MSTDDTLRELGEKEKKRYDEHAKWKASTLSLQKGDMVSVTLPGIVVDTEELGVTTLIKVYLEDSGKTIEMFMPEEGFKIEPR